MNEYELIGLRSLTKLKQHTHTRAHTHTTDKKAVKKTQVWF